MIARIVFDCALGAAIGTVAYFFLWGLRIILLKGPPPRAPEEARPKPPPRHPNLVTLGSCPVEACRIKEPHSHADALIRRIKEK